MLQTIASPHLGVRHHTVYDDFGIALPDNIFELIASLFGKSGSDLGSVGYDSLSTRYSPYASPPADSSDNDEEEVCLSESLSNSEPESPPSRPTERESLIYRMATEEVFLAPLRSFKKRRALANLKSDVFVPLGTAAMLSHDTVRQLRTEHGSREGVVAILNTTTIHVNSEVPEVVLHTSHVQTQTNTKHDATNEPVSTALNQSEPDNNSSSNTKSNCQSNITPLDEMRISLDSCGWEKVIVHFKVFIPLAHNQIAALTKFSHYIDKLFGFHDGRHIMDEAAVWLTSV